MAATTTLPFFFLLLSHNPPSPSTYHHHRHHQSKLPAAMFAFLVVFTLTLSIFIFSLHRRLRRRVTQNPNSATTQCPPSETINRSGEKPSTESKLSDLGHSLLVEILPSNSPKWDALFSEEAVGLDQTAAESSKPGDSGGEDGGKKKRKKRGKKKRPDSPNSTAEECGGGGGEGGRISAKEALRLMKEKQELVCLYPFTSSSSATQRKIKQQYDQLVKSHESTGLTLTQVAQFVNCLIEAKTELQHKSDVIQRKFTITKALLFKADRSSFDRLRQQIYKLELEQKRLEEDAFVYNWLQQQLKLSPAYKKMIEVGACMELKAKVKEQTESADAECRDISFEELLEQEKKDSFWQKNRKPRSTAS